MKRIKNEKKSLTPTFYATLSTPYFEHDSFMDFLTRRIKILRLIEDNITDIKLLNFDSQEDDAISHFITRIVCSQVEWVSKWFIQMETKLFRIRLLKCTNIEDFFYNGCLKYYNKINVENNDGLLNLYLPRSSYFTKTSASKSIETDYLSDKIRIFVHFTKVIDLFSKRVLKVKKGYCELNKSSYVSFLTNEFKRYLTRKIEKCVSMSSTNVDDRLFNICKNMFVENNFAVASSSFSFGNELKFFPPCIQQIIETFKKNKHIKYNDRQSFCLFLKDCGMPLEETINLFREWFNMPKVEFDKKYLYNIRHNYGLEGKRANYMCFSCSKMAHYRNGEGKSGCPFLDNKGYIDRLTKSSILGSPVDIEDIFKDTLNTKRCTSFLEKLTLKKYDRVVTTPIKYYVTYKDSVKDNPK